VYSAFCSKCIQYKFGDFCSIGTHFNCHIKIIRTPKKELFSNNSLKECGASYNVPAFRRYLLVLIAKLAFHVSLVKSSHFRWNQICT
jgi:hypothetical protein